jgi:hypothetical protein
MRSIYSFVIAGLAPLLVNCSIHPLVDDVTRITTADVVRQIRCEAKRAVNEYGLHSKDASAIAYEFTFTIFENNDATGDLTSEIPFLSGGNFSLVANAHSKRKRHSQRVFRIVDSFEDLRRTACDREALEKNWVYPIAGEIGIYEVVGTFARLQRLSHLTDLPPASQPDTLGSDFPRAKVFSFADTLTFITTFNGGVAPKLTLNRVTERLRVTEANANLHADRADTHKVVIGMAAIPVETDRKRRGRSAMRVANAPDGNPTNNAILATTLTQLQATAKERALFELDRQRMIALQQQIPNVLVGQ